VFKFRPHHLFGDTTSFKHQLLRGGTGSLGVKVINQVLSLALGIALARGLGPSGYGIYSFTFAVLTVLIVLAELGMPLMLVREIAKSEALEDWPHLRGVIIRSLQTVFFSSITLSFLVFSSLWLFNNKFSPTQTETFFWICALLPLLVVTKALFSILTGLRHVVKAQALEMPVRTFLVASGVFSLYSFAPKHLSPQNAMAVQVIAATIVFMATTVLLYKLLPQQALIIKAQFRSRAWLTAAIPLTLIGGTDLINNQADILMLQFFGSSKDVGIYRVSVQGAILVSFSMQALSSVISPQFARLHSLGDKDRLQRLVTVSARIIFLLALPVCFTLILAGKPIITLIFGAEFTESHVPLAILAAGNLFIASMGPAGFLLVMTGHERIMSKIMVMTAGLNIFLNFFLIPPFGAIGAACATVISIGILYSALLLTVKKCLGINTSIFST
jgi:O-antigen/teichoic acid export membrane protein